MFSFDEPLMMLLRRRVTVHYPLFFHMQGQEHDDSVCVGSLGHPSPVVAALLSVPTAPIPQAVCAPLTPAPPTQLRSPDTVPSDGHPCCPPAAVESDQVPIAPAAMVDAKEGVEDALRLGNLLGMQPDFRPVQGYSSHSSTEPIRDLVQAVNARTR